MKYNLRSAIIASAALAFAPVPASATVDAFSSFNGTNGNGNFWYLALDGLGGASILTPGSNCGATTCLQTVQALDGPGAYKAAAPFTFGTISVPNDKLVLVPDVHGLIITYQAQTAGSYTFNGLFDAVDSQATGIFALDSRSSVIHFQPLIPYNIVPHNRTFSTTLNLNALESYFLLVLPGQTAAHDATGFNLSVTNNTLAAVPEPATWALMLVGFGLAGVALRRHPKVAVRFS